MSFYVRCLALSLAAAALVSCEAPDQKGAQNAPTPAVSVTIFRGGPIYTGLEEAPIAEAVAVADGIILAVGSADLVAAGAGDDPVVVDLQGASLYPGFTDAHAHLLGVGMRELTLNLEGTASVAELVAIVEASVNSAAAGEFQNDRCRPIVPWLADNR